MVSIGSPDYQTDQVQSDSVVFSNTVAISPGAFLSAVLPVSQWAGLIFTLQSVPVADTLVQIDFYADAGATIAVARREFIFSPNLTNNPTYTLPALGSYVQMNVIANTGAVINVLLTLFGTNRVGPTIPNPILAPLVEVNNVAVAAGATNTVEITSLAEGPCHLTINTTLASGTVRITMLDNGFAVRNLFRHIWTAALGAVTFSPIYLAPSHLQLTLNNTTGAPGNFFAYMVAESWGHET